MVAFVAPLVLMLAAGAGDEADAPYGRPNERAPGELARLDALLGEYRTRDEDGGARWLRVSYLLDGWGLEIEQRDADGAELWILLFDPLRSTWWVEVLRAPYLVSERLVSEQLVSERASWVLEPGAERLPGFSMWAGSPDGSDGERRRLAQDALGGLVLEREQVQAGVASSHRTELAPKAAGVESPWASEPFGAPHADAPPELEQLAFLIGEYKVEGTVYCDGAAMETAEGTRVGRYALGGRAIRTYRHMQPMNGGRGSSFFSFSLGFLLFDPGRKTFRYWGVASPGDWRGTWTGSFEGDEVLFEPGVCSESDVRLARFRIVRSGEDGFEMRIEEPDAGLEYRERHTRIR